MPKIDMGNGAEEFVATDVQRNKIRDMFLPTELLGVVCAATTTQGQPLVLPGNELLLDHGINEDGSQWTKSVSIDNLINALDLETKLGPFEAGFGIDDLINAAPTKNTPEEGEGYREWLIRAKSKYGL